MAPFNQYPKTYRALPRASLDPAHLRNAKDGAHREWHHVLMADLLTGVLWMELKALDPIHVGSGSAELIRVGGKESLVRGIVYERGGYFIPGTSIKGVARSNHEALAGGCDLDRNCDPPCPTCSLFGQIASRKQLMGRVGFGDALPVGRPGVGLSRLPRAFRPRSQVGRRVYGARVDERADVPYLVIKAGTLFSLPLELANVRPAELAMVLAAMGVGQGFVPRYGGGKFGGLGRIQARPSKAVLRRSARDLRHVHVEGAKMKSLLAQWMKQLRLAPGGDAAMRVLKGVAI